VRIDCPPGVSQDRQECPSAPAVLSTLSTAALPTGLENPFKTLELTEAAFQWLPPLLQRLDRPVPLDP